MSETLFGIRRRALRTPIPPPRLRLSEWIEGNSRMTESEAVAAQAVVALAA